MAAPVDSAPSGVLALHAGELEQSLCAGALPLLSPTELVRLARTSRLFHSRAAFLLWYEGLRLPVPAATGVACGRHLNAPPPGFGREGSGTFAFLGRGLRRWTFPAAPITGSNSLPSDRVAGEEEHSLPSRAEDEWRLRTVTSCVRVSASDGQCTRPRDAVTRPLVFPGLLPNSPLVTLFDTRGARCFVASRDDDDGATAAAAAAAAGTDDLWVAVDLGARLALTLTGYALRHNSTQRRALRNWTIEAR